MVRFAKLFSHSFTVAPLSRRDSICEFGTTPFRPGGPWGIQPCDRRLNQPGITAIEHFQSSLPVTRSEDLLKNLLLRRLIMSLGFTPPWREPWEGFSASSMASSATLDFSFSPDLQQSLPLMYDWLSPFAQGCASLTFK